MFFIIPVLNFFEFCKFLFHSFILIQIPIQYRMWTIKFRFTLDSELFLWSRFLHKSASSTHFKCLVCVSISPSVTWIPLSLWWWWRARIWSRWTAHWGKFLTSTLGSFPVWERVTSGSQRQCSKIINIHEMSSLN